MEMSPRLSFKGYNIGTALYRNKDGIKAILAILSGVNFLTGFEWKTLLLSLAGGIAMLAVKILTDAIEYFFSEVIDFEDNEDFL